MPLLEPNMRPTLTAVLFLLGCAASPGAAQGLHADVHAGLDSVRSDGQSSEGATYGLTLGYDLRRGGALLGVQVDLDASDNDSCRRDVFLSGDRACVSARRDTAIALRAGAAVGGSALVYGTVGYANARFNVRYSLAGVSDTDQANVDGVRLGLGVSADFSRRLYGKVEYRYTNYEQGISRHQGIAGVGVRF
jgi:outer membrane immunogenic protein